ncbi:hypothetical protein E2I00_010496, partial [Balaenoptera physalus]
PLAPLTMEKQGRSEMEIIPSESHSYIKLLKVNREHLVTHVRKILDLVQSKGEEVSEFFLYVLQRLADAYTVVGDIPALSFQTLSFKESSLTLKTETKDNVPECQCHKHKKVSRYSQKLRQQLGRDSKFILCYAQKEELLLEEMYTDTIVELVDFGNESLGSLGSLACLLDPSTGVLNEHGETIFVFGDAGVGKSMLLQRLQSLWAAGQLDAELSHLRAYAGKMFPERAVRQRLLDQLEANANLFSLCARNTRSQTETFRAGRGTLRSLGQAFFAAFFLVVDDKVGTRELLRFFQEWAPHGEAAAASCYPRFLPSQCLGGRGLAGEDPFKNKDHFHFTNLFLCGLLSKGKQKLLRHLVPAAALRRKRRALWACLFASLRSHLKNLPRVQSGSFSQVQAMPTFLWMLRCIYETQSEKRLALDLDNNNLNDYGVRELRPCFSRLTVIRLSVNQITDSGVKVLCEELPKYKILTFLGLYNNQITDVGARYVARILDECTGLTHLKLGKNKITSEGGKCLALAVKNSKSIFEV